jgi:Lecithin:cholesterol acyltransferase
MQPRLHVNHSHDAVVLIPGIMGSALEDVVTRKTLWGLSDLGWYGRAWRDGSSLRELSDLTPGRIKPQGLLRFPAWAPLGHFEPYGRLLRRLEDMAHPRAICEFAYDWRLPVLHNARLLARAAHEHLVRWRADPDHERLRELQSNRSPARLVLIAHSMGGLLVRALPLVEGTDDEAGPIPAVSADIRATVTLGTPFRGAAKAAEILASGPDLLAPRRRMTRLARQLPGIYDLLPSYKCVNVADDRVRHLTAQDVAGFGGDPAQARRAFDFRRQLDGLSLTGHHPVIGVEQPTVTLLRLAGGSVQGLGYTYHLADEDGEIVRDERGVPARFPTCGDGTVPVDSAALPGIDADPRALQHGGLAYADAGIEPVRWVMAGGPRGSGLGPRNQVGIDAPDIVPVGAEFAVTVTGEGAPGATCRVTDVETGRYLGRPEIGKRDGQWIFNLALPEGHLYEIVVDGGESPLKRMTLATSPDEPADDTFGAG